MAFEITMVVAGSVAEITLSGELDASSALLFQKELEATVAVKPTQLVLRMRDLVYIASAGLRMLLFAKQRLGSGLTIYVVAPREQVVDTLRRTGIHHSVVILDEYPATTG